MERQMVLELGMEFDKGLELVIERKAEKLVLELERNNEGEDKD